MWAVGHCTLQHLTDGGVKVIGKEWHSRVSGVIVCWHKYKLMNVINIISIDVSSSIQFFIPHPPPSPPNIVFKHHISHILHYFTYFGNMPKKRYWKLQPPKMLPPYCRYLPIFPHLSDFSSRDVIQGLRVAVLRLQLCQAEPQALWTHWVAPLTTWENLKIIGPKHGLNQDGKTKRICKSVRN